MDKTKNSAGKQNIRITKDLVHKGMNLIRSAMMDLLGLVDLCFGKEPHFFGSSRIALEQWKYSLTCTSPPTKERLLIAATRNRRWVEWAVFSACYTLKMGYWPILIYSSEEMSNIYLRRTFWEHFGSNFWGAVKSLPYITTIDLDDFLNSPDEDYADFAREKAHMATAYDLHVEEFEGADTDGDYERALEKNKQMLRMYAKAAEHVFRSNVAKRLICPSGLIGRSIAMREAARRTGLTGIFVEGWAMRPGHNIWNVNEPALRYDMEGWMRYLGKWDASKEAEAQDFIAFREGAHVQRDGWLDNFHKVQRSKKDAPLPPKLLDFLARPGAHYLLGTNVIGDSATLGRDTIFRSQRDWINQVVGFFRDHKELNLIVRAHPDEVWARARQKLGDIAEAAADGAKNIFVLHGSDNVNTYSLVDKIDVGLAWVSNIGLDMAIRGKPVILAADAEYAFLGACQVASSPSEYFHFLLVATKLPVLTSPELIERAKAYHYILFRMMSLKSDSERYNSVDYRLGDPNEHPDRSKFYRILTGELGSKGQPLI
jgi:hypothetical protein